LYSAPNCQVSSSYVESFESYRANKQTDKLTNLKLTNKLTNRRHWKHTPRSTMLRRWVNTNDELATLHSVATEQLYLSLN